MSGNYINFRKPFKFSDSNDDNDYDNNDENDYDNDDNYGNDDEDDSFFKDSASTWIEEWWDCKPNSNIHNMKERILHKRQLNKISSNPRVIHQIDNIDSLEGVGEELAKKDIYDVTIIGIYLSIYSNIYIYTNIYIYVITST
jgi:hypothetical protein